MSGDTDTSTSDQGDLPIVLRDEHDGMLFEEAIGLAWAIMHTWGWRVDGLTDRAYHPGNWRVHTVYQPRKPNGRPSGVRVAKWVRSPDDWQEWRVRAIELNTRHSRVAAKTYYYGFQHDAERYHWRDMSGRFSGRVYRFAKRAERDAWVSEHPRREAENPRGYREAPLHYYDYRESISAGDVRDYRYTIYDPKTGVEIDETSTESTEGK